jgi:DNA polymerase III subunit gamma/tau
MFETGTNRCWTGAVTWSVASGTVSAGQDAGGGPVALALYRKYRPRTFSEVIGQEQVTEPLMQALRSGRLHHAYLFSGPRGCGKTSSARILARSLNCAKGPTPEPCGECESCQALALDGPGSIDVIEIDAASHGGVDDARDLRERAFFAPVASRYKVYVIDEAHMVSTQGFNALLKLVEEPPDYVMFIFATTEPEKVLGTIRSRTHHYPFRLIPPGVLRPYLERLCREEGVSVEPAVFPLVVRAGGGSVRDSLSVLDQLIAGAGVYGVTYARAVGLLGVTDVALIDEMTDALAASDGAAAFATIDRVSEAGHDARRFAADLLERLRDLIVLQRVPDAAASGIIDVPVDQLERMTAQAARMGPATLSRLADIVHNGLTEMRGTTAPRLLLELITARMLLPGADDTHGALLQRVERMERRLGAAEPDEDRARGGPAHQTAPARGARLPDEALTLPSPPEPPTPTTPPPTPGPPAGSAVVAAESASVPAPESGAGTTPEPGASVLDAAAIRRVWDEVLSVVRRRSPRAWAVVREASVRDVHGEEIVLLFQHAVHANMFGAQVDLLVEALREVVGGSWQVRAELRPGGDEPARPAGPPRPAAAMAPAGESVAALPREGDWPEAARPGEPARPEEAARPGEASRPGEAGSVQPGGASTSASGRRRAPKGTGRTGTTAAAAPRAGAGASASPRPGQAERPGFDPGDEPLDDADSSGIRQTSEERAIALLTEQLGAEPIGEAKPRGA